MEAEKDRWNLTGNKKFRQSVFGNFVLQVEEHRKVKLDEYSGTLTIKTRWRDARSADIFPAFQLPDPTAFLLDRKK